MFKSMWNWLFKEQKKKESIKLRTASRCIEGFVYLDKINQTYKTHNVIFSKIRSGDLICLLLDGNNRNTKKLGYNSDVNLNRLGWYE